MVSTGPRVNLPAPYTQDNVKVVVEGLWIDGYDGDGYDKIIGVRGTATNVGSVDLLTCSIEFNVVNKSGARVAAAHTIMLGLKSGETWAFQATFSTPFAGSFKSVEPGTITAMNER
jgi:hypothetical protein